MKKVQFKRGLLGVDNSSLVADTGSLISKSVVFMTMSFSIIILLKSCNTLLTVVGSGLRTPDPLSGSSDKPATQYRWLKIEIHNGNDEVKGFIILYSLKLYNIQFYVYIHAASIKY